MSHTITFPQTMPIGLRIPLGACVTYSFNSCWGCLGGAVVKGCILLEFYVLLLLRCRFDSQ